MGREAQPPYSRLTPRLEADLQRINFYRLCQLLEKRQPDRPLMGSTSHPPMIRYALCRIRGWGFRLAN